jgi:hypothetical protein
MNVFSDVTAYSLLEVNQRFGGTCHLHLQGKKICQARNQYEAEYKQSNALTKSSGLCRKQERTAKEFASSHWLAHRTE